MKEAINRNRSNKKVINLHFMSINQREMNVKSNHKQLEVDKANLREHGKKFINI